MERSYRMIIHPAGEPKRAVVAADRVAAAKGGGLLIGGGTRSRALDRSRQEAT